MSVEIYQYFCSFTILIGIFFKLREIAHVTIRIWPKERFEMYFRLRGEHSTT